MLAFSSNWGAGAAKQSEQLGDLRDLSVYLARLACGDLAYVRVPDFIPAQSASRLATRLTAAGQRSYYAKAPQVAKIGSAFFDSNNDVHCRHHYHNQVASYPGFLEQVCAEEPSPLNVVLAWLRERLSSGVTAEALDGQPMSAGLFRILEAGGHIGPHQDSLQVDAPAALTPRKMVGQLALNLYLELPATGGELLIWNHSFTPEEYARRQLMGSPDIDSRFIKAPDFVLTPQPGELIFINSTHLHAVAAVKQGCRVTFALFLGYYGQERAWTVWN